MAIREPDWIVIPSEARDLGFCLQRPELCVSRNLRSKPKRLRLIPLAR
jgi:hypothetical protein